MVPHPALVICRRKLIELSDNTQLLFYEAIDGPKVARTESYCHCSATGKTLKFFSETHKVIPDELKQLLRTTIRVTLLEELVTSGR